MNLTESKVATYKKLLENLEKERASLPPGHLIIRGTRYYQRIDGHDRGITRQPKKVQQLARARYIDTLIKIIKNVLNTTPHKIKDFKFPTHQEIINKLPKTFSKLPDDYFKLTHLNDWLSKKHSQNPRYREDLVYPTKSGILVRSKEEILISNTLTDLGIPHKYEAPYQLAGKTIYPDFTLINPYTTKETLWEHHGAFHLENYGLQSHQKLLAYCQSGLIPNDTLIITYPDDIKIPNRLKKIIKNTLKNT
ncbi:MAG: hypothetical protein FWE07_04005 [Turicibacter sp.]|nr:hypothetical protein [Turicibacter sp.]